MLLNDNFTKFECKSTLFPNVYSVIEVNAATCAVKKEDARSTPTHHRISVAKRLLQ